MTTKFITGVTARLPGVVGDYTKQPTNNNGERSPGEVAFLRLWKMQCPNLPEPEREVRFSTDRKWRFDFAWQDVKLAVEIEGMAPGGGRHQRRGGFNRDAEKYNAATALGWRVLRFTSDDMRAGPVQVIKQVASVYGKLKQEPTP